MAVEGGEGDTTRPLSNTGLPDRSETAPTDAVNCSSPAQRKLVGSPTAGGLRQPTALQLDSAIPSTNGRIQHRTDHVDANGLGTAAAGAGPAKGPGPIPTPAGQSPLGPAEGVQGPADVALPGLAQANQSPPLPGSVNDSLIQSTHYDTTAAHLPTAFSSAAAAVAAAAAASAPAASPGPSGQPAGAESGGGASPGVQLAAVLGSGQLPEVASAATSIPTTNHSLRVTDPDYELPLGLLTETRVLLSQPRPVRLDPFGFVLPPSPSSTAAQAAAAAASTTTAPGTPKAVAGQPSSTAPDGATVGTGPASGTPQRSAASLPRPGAGLAGLISSRQASHVRNPSLGAGSSGGAAGAAAAVAAAAAAEAQPLSDDAAAEAADRWRREREREREREDERGRERQLRRIRKWMKMLGPDGSNLAAYMARKPAKFKRRIRKGVPEQFRGLVWHLLSGGRDLLRANPGRFAVLSRVDSGPAPAPAPATPPRPTPPTHTPAPAPPAPSAPSPTTPSGSPDAPAPSPPSPPPQQLPLPIDRNVDTAIMRDLNRTFPTHIFFMQRQGQGQRALYSVLRAYAVHDPGVGYVQGMGFLAAVLLLYMSAEEAFWTLVALLQGRERGGGRNAVVGVRGLFEPGVPMLQCCLFQFKRLLAAECPRLARHLAAEGVEPELYATHWFNTAFAYTLPFQHLLRLWDIMMLEGNKVVFRMALAVMRAAERRLLPLPFEKLVEALSAKSLPSLLPERPESLLRPALRIPVSERLAALAAEWREQQDRLQKQRERQRQGQLRQQQQAQGRE